METEDQKEGERQKRNDYLELFRNMNWNVKLALIFTGGNIATWAITQGQLLSGYLYLLTGGSNSFIGTCNAMTGLAQLVAFPVGYLGDKYRRDSLFRVGGVVGIFCIILSIFGFCFVPPFEEPDCPSIGTEEGEDCSESKVLGCFGSLCIFIYLMVASWGLWGGTTNPTLESIFADSVETGDRTTIYTTKFLVFRISQSFGPLLACVMLLILGDEWKMSILRPILVVGALFWIIPVTTTFLFDDDKALGRTSEGIGSEQYSKLTAQQTDDEEIVEDSFTIEEEEEDPGPISVNERRSKCGSDIKALFGALFSPSSPHFVPLMLSGSDFINALASGMTVKFFPLFFQFKSNMSPLGVSIVYLIIPLACAFVSFVNERIAKKVGRIPMIFFCRLFGVTLLCLMILSTNAYIVSTLFILRTALMRSPVPLVRSVLMDVVNKSDRGKWNAVESFSSFSFLGSAMVGGFLIDWKGYGASILVTGFFQYIALIPLIPLFRYFSEEEVQQARIQNIQDPFQSQEMRDVSEEVNEERNEEGKESEGTSD
mmetsp:Transcript_9044/g.12124  ORF Transcript_9044/g.12124 Transcript_9044/m.12124 type:complete len:541 (+) Transcript_9044:210-1832(+)